MKKEDDVSAYMYTIMYTCVCVCVKINKRNKYVIDTLARKQMYGPETILYYGITKKHSPTLETLFKN